MSCVQQFFLHLFVCTQKFLPTVRIFRVKQTFFWSQGEALGGLSLVGKVVNQKIVLKRFALERRGKFASIVVDILELLLKAETVLLIL
jgi:hypothetical protein